MKIGGAQLICLVAGVFLLALGSGLAGGRWAIEREGLLSPKPSQVDQIPDESKPAEPVTNAPAEATPSLSPSETSTLPPAATEQNPPLPFAAGMGQSPASAGPASTPVAGPPADKASKSPVRYVVQAVSTPSRNDASAARKRIMNAGYSAGIFEVDLGERGKWYRVYIGPYDTETEAQQVLTSVKQISGFTSSFVKPLE
jgi:cell division protein FtsN